MEKLEQWKSKCAFRGPIGKLEENVSNHTHWKENKAL